MQDFATTSWIAVLGQQAAEFFGMVAGILRALPEAPGAFRHTLGALRGTGGDGFPGLAVALAGVVLALAPGPMATPRPGRSAALRHGWPVLAGLLLDDGTAALAIVIAGSLAVATLAAGHDAGSALGAALLWGIVRWRISLLAVSVFLRPSEPALRLLAVADDASVRAAIRLAGLAFAIALAFVSIVPVLLVHGLELLPARAVALVAASAVAVLAAAAWRRLKCDDGSIGAAPRAVGFGLIGAGWFIWIRSVVRLDFALWDAFTATVSVGLLVLAIALAGRLLTGAVGAHPSGTGSMDRAAAVGAATRSLVVSATVLGTGWVLRDWLVDVTELVPPEGWAAVWRAVVVGAGVSLAGYLAHEALRTWAALRFGTPRLPAVPGSDDDEFVAGSRLATALPIVARCLMAVSIGVGVLLTLANLGVNVGPLLAGAGIFGLAISFGSQALVRDIVSGFFFIADDAFRVGEYIDTGKHKGSVESIALRSLRLRHQNGQVHTIPYGQIAAVTNFSRDWSTMKFNLRFAPETDLEKVRKTAKKIGLALLDDPEWGPEFIVPLKLQGIADIVETAVVLRFKFTARPLKIASLQREVVRRLFDSLLQAGVRFATNAIVLRSDPGEPEDAAEEPRFAPRSFGPRRRVTWLRRARR
jgi:small-conductance mechanosensitive channel